MLLFSPSFGLFWAPTSQKPEIQKLEFPRVYLHLSDCALQFIHFIFLFHFFLSFLSYLLVLLFISSIPFILFSEVQIQLAFRYRHSSVPHLFAAASFCLQIVF